MAHHERWAAKMKQPILIFTLAIASFARALACSCDGLPSMEIEFARSDAVFVGRVVQMSIETRSESDRRYEVRVCRFEIGQSFKGIEDQKKDFTVVTRMAGTACGFPFELGEGYLVYASTYRGEMETNVCRRTRPLVKPKEVTDTEPPPDPFRKTELDESGRLEAEQLREFLKKKEPNQPSQPTRGKAPRG